MNIFSEDTSQPPPNERARPDQPSSAARHADQPSPAERYDDEQDEFSFSSLSRTFWANKWGIFFTSALFAGLAAWFVFTETPLYTATTLVVLETDETKVVNFDSVLPGISSDDTALNTEIEVLHSRVLMDRTVETLALEQDPEFNPRLRPAPAWKEKFGYDRIMTALGLAPDNSAPTPEQVRQDIIDVLLDKMRVSIIPKT